MKRLSKIVIPMFILVALMMGACAPAGTADDTSGASKVQASPLEFTGMITAMDGNRWTVGDQVITVAPSVLRDGPFTIGDTVKVEAEVQADGSIVVISVEAPSADSNSNDANSNDSNSNDDNNNSDDDNGNDGLVFDDSGTEAFGTLESITVDTVLIGGQAFSIGDGTEFKNQIQAGDFVKVHFSMNADGTMTITEIESWDPALVDDDNSNSNSNTSIDDNGNDDNSNDDNSNDDSNDDNGNDDNSGSDDNGNDDNGNDD